MSHEYPARQAMYSAFWKKLLIRLVSIFAVLQFTFILSWLLVFSRERNGNAINEEKEMVMSVNEEKVEKLFTTNVNRFPEKKSQDLLNQVKNAFGRNLQIDFTQSKDDKKAYATFNYASPHFPKKIDFSQLKPNTHTTEHKPVRYVYVYCRYWEQMTMNTRSFLSLSGQAKIGGRKVVKPFVKDSRFGRYAGSWHNLKLYFSMKDMDNILEASEYAALVDNKEYDNECLLNNSTHATIHFLYHAENAERFTKTRLRMSDNEYNKLTQSVKKNGWTKCSFPEPDIRKRSGSNQFCVDPAVITEWSVLERDVVRGAKCLTIYIWRGIGVDYRTYFSEKGLKVPSKDIQFALKPSVYIQNEVERLRKSSFPGHYIAVQVRGERVVISHNLDRLRECINLLTEVIQALKKTSNISQVVLATDMSNFGSASWVGSLKGETYDEHTLPNLHNSLVSGVGGVVYKPTDDHPDNGVVALVEMALISHAQHLVTIGGGSFQEWIIAKFLEHHRDDAGTHPAPLWSQIKMCSN